LARANNDKLKVVVVGTSPSGAEAQDFASTTGIGEGVTILGSDYGECWDVFWEAFKLRDTSSFVLLDNAGVLIEGPAAFDTDEVLELL